MSSIDVGKIHEYYKTIISKIVEIFEEVIKNTIVAVLTNDIEKIRNAKMKLNELSTIISYDRLSEIEKLLREVEEYLSSSEIKISIEDLKKRVIKDENVKVRLFEKMKNVSRERKLEEGVLYRVLDNIYVGVENGELVIYVAEE